MREGSKLQLAISSPGRNHGTWQFETPSYVDEPSFALAYGEMMPSTLRLQVLPNIDIPIEYPDCFALRGQPCRPFVMMENISEE